MAVANASSESQTGNPDDLTDDQKAIVEMVHQFVDEQILPNAEEYDHEDKFPEPIVEQMKELGLFGVTIPEEYGGMGLDLTTYAMIVEELSRGWISISGVVNTHFIGSYLLMKFGTDEQKDYFLPKMATGEIRAAFSLSEPEVGSDVQGIKSTAKQDGDDWVLDGQKMWVTNGLGSGVVFVLMKTDPKADPPHKGMTCFITEKEPWADKNEGKFEGLEIPPKIKKMGYKGVESTELVYSGYRCPSERILGGEDGVGKGFAQMMDALEVGRVNVAARGVGIAQRALELALRYSQERKTFGKPIAQHQAIQFKLADMATKIEAARLAHPQGRADEGRRRALRPRGRDGEAARLRDRQGVRRGVVPHPRRLRLLEGVRDRAPLPRRAAAADRRGHLRDPAHGDRQEAAGAQQDLSWAPPRSGSPSSPAPAAGSGRRSRGSSRPITACACWRVHATPATSPSRRGVVPVQLDVADDGSVAALRERVEADPGRLDVLVNNAGVGGSYSDAAAEIPLDEVRDTLESTSSAPGAWSRRCCRCCAAATTPASSTSPAAPASSPT